MKLFWNLLTVAFALLGLFSAYQLACWAVDEWYVFVGASTPLTSFVTLALGVVATYGRYVIWHAERAKSQQRPKDRLIDYQLGKK